MRIPLELCDICCPWPQCSRFHIPFKPMLLCLHQSTVALDPLHRRPKSANPQEAPQATQALQRGTHLFPAVTEGGESDHTY